MTDSRKDIDKDLNANKVRTDKDNQQGGTQPGKVDRDNDGKKAE